MVFDGVRRAPLPLLNEKVLCGIGRQVHRAGRLDPDGVERALDTLERFGALLRAMNVAEVDAVATAAVRDAADGDEFVARAARRSGLAVRVLSGAEEARASALGVLGGIPGADGLMGDLGGGSLELARLAGGAIAEHATLPLGPLNLAAAAGGDRARARDAIDAALDTLPWLERAAGAELYAVGGNWRALARAHMAKTGYPLRVIHHYRAPAEELAGFAAAIAGKSREAMAGVAGAPRRRAALMPLAALTLERLLRRAAPRHAVFSALGLREGLVQARLPEAVRREDPLLAACRDIAARAARFPEYGDELDAWTGGLFPGESASERRLRRAACLLNDIGWRQHPDYRAEHASAEALRAPALHASHAERCFLAHAVFARYASRETTGALAAAGRLMDAESRRRARILGAAMRLGEALCGGAPGILGRFSLSLPREGGAPRLTCRRRDRVMPGEAAMRRFETLAALMGGAPEFRVLDDAAATGAAP